MDPERRPEYDRLKKQFEDLKKALPPQYPYLQGAAEFDPMDLNLNIRGNPEALGEVVPRQFPRRPVGRQDDSAQSGKRPASTGGHRGPSSTGGTCRSQPHLARAVRPGPGAHAFELRPRRRPSRAAGTCWNSWPPVWSSATIPSRR